MIIGALATGLKSGASSLVGKGAPAAYGKWLSSRKMQTDIDAAWTAARSETQSEYGGFGALVDEQHLLKTVLEHALDPNWLNNPDSNELWNAVSLRWSGSDQSRKAVEAFLRHFVERWKRTESFSANATLFEEIKQNESLDAIRNVLGGLSATIESALNTGFAVRPAPVSAPQPEVLLEYTKGLDAGSAKPFYIERMVLQKATRRHTAPTQAIALDRALDENEVAVLVGEGGLGKTMALGEREGRLAAQYAVGSTGPVPVMLRLAEYGGGTIERFIADRISGVLKGSRTHLAETAEESERVVQRWLEEGGHTVEIMFDGLNETPADRVQELESELKGFLRYHQKFIFTARDPEASPLAGHEAPVFTLLPLSPDEVNEFLRHKLADGGHELFSRVNSDSRFPELLQNPFFLEIVAELAAASAQPVPRHRALLIREYAAQVPQKLRRIAGRAGRLGVMEKFLKALAWKMLRSGVLAADYAAVFEWSLPLSGLELEEVLRGASAYRHLRSAGLDQEPIEFRHSLLRDYFAAEHIFDQIKGGNALDQATEGQFEAPEWRDPVRMTAGLLGPQSGGIVMWLANKNSLDLAFDCWADSEAMDDPGVTGSLAAALRAFITPRNIEYADTIIVQLGELRDPAAVPLIGEFMDRAGPWARFEAVPALEKIRSPEALDKLAVLLGHRDEDTSRLAAETIRAIGREAVPALLRSPSGMAGTILGELAPSAVAELTTALRDSDQKVRARAVLALGSSQDPQAALAISALIASQKDAEILVRTQAAIALGKLKNPAVIPALISSLKNEENPGARFEAASALWKNGWSTEEARAALFDMYKTLGSRYPSWKVHVLECLMAQPDAEIVAEVFKACRDSDYEIRKGGFSLLRDFPADAAFPDIDDLLSQGLRDSTDFIVTLAAAGLYNRHGSEALRWITEAFEENPARTALLDAIWTNYGQSGQEFLIRVLNSALDQEIRAKAADRLHTFRGEATQAALAEALEKADPATESRLVFHLIRGVRRSTDPMVIARLRSIAGDQGAPEAIRDLAGEVDRDLSDHLKTGP